ncbi:MAG: M24 family metallopeptidase [Actinomycetota bacterium]
MAAIEKKEFDNRVKKVRNKMDKNDIDLLLVYGDEYRCENLRYLSNYWPLFERGMLAVSKYREPVLLVSPECEHLAREMSAWQDIRLIREIGMSYVPEEVGFTNIEFTTIPDVVNYLIDGRKVKKFSICGVDAMSVILYNQIMSVIEDAEFINGDNLLYDLRIIKSRFEIENLKKAWEICDKGYKAILDSDIVGLTEIQAAAIGEKAARDAGAEQIVFSVFGSGERTNTVIGRPTEKKISKGEMIMSALAIRYNGYIASNEWPFVAGNQPSEKQLEFIYHLVKAEDIGVKSIKEGVKASQAVKKISEYFKDNNLEKHDLYPPIHGNGLAEAESPYPDENSNYNFEVGMGINFDVSLFGVPGIGSNRIEEGFIVTDDGLLSLSKLISGLREEFLKKF